MELLTIVGDGAILRATAGSRAIIRIHSGRVALERLDIEITAPATGVDVVGPADVSLDRVKIVGDAARPIGQGVSVTGATFFRMDRSVIVGTAGLFFDRSGGYSITNSVFDANSYVLGAVLLYPPTRTDPAARRFVGNTVMRSRDHGVACIGHSPVFKSVLFYRNTYDTAAYCHPVASYSGDVPFDPARPYHLTSAAACCIDKGDSTEVPPHDLDGDPRPRGALPDIGADEF